MKKISIIIFIIINSSAFASQCKFLPKKQVRKAKDIIMNSKSTNPIFIIDRYCEACLDSYPKPIVVENVEVKRSSKVASLFVNNKIEDMAYIYINGENLAKKIGCKTLAVSANLD